MDERRLGRGIVPVGRYVDHMVLTGDIPPDPDDILRHREHSRGTFALHLPLETQPDGRVWVKCVCGQLVRYDSNWVWGRLRRFKAEEEE